MNDERTLWNECVEILKKADNNNLNFLLDELVRLVVRNKNIFSEIADLNFLEFCCKVNSNEYIIGTTGDNFEGLAKQYINIKKPIVDKIWRVVSNLIWDLTTFTSEEICPNCRSDNLRLLTDISKEKVYKACETCFWIEHNGKAVSRSKDLFPANKHMVLKYLKSYKANSHT